jgi:hypothetical protein
MIRSLLLAAISCWSLICSCKNDPQQTEETLHDTTAVNDSVSAPSPYFPVYAYMKSEIQYVDSLPVGIIKYTTVGSKKDSGYIQLEEFHRLADEFITSDVTDSTFAKRYKETSFVDRTNGNATFLYTTADPLAEIKRIDIVTAKGDTYDEVKSIYIEKRSQSSDTPVVKKLYWKPKKNFQLITIKTSAGKSQDQLVKVVWDNRE